MTWFVYILKCADGTYYTGITTDLNKRLRQHNGQASGGARYTRSRRPVKLAWSSTRDSRSSAARSEHTIKQMDRLSKEHFIRSWNRIST